MSIFGHLSMTHGYSKPAAAPAAHLPWRMAEVTLPSPCGAHPGSSRGLRLGSFTIHKRRTEKSNLSPFGASRFPSGARALAGSFSKAEGERIERPWDSRPNLRLATGCLATRPAFHCAQGEIRTLTALPDHAGLSRACLPFHHLRME